MTNTMTKTENLSLINIWALIFWLVQWTDPLFIKKPNRNLAFIHRDRYAFIIFKTFKEALINISRTFSTQKDKNGLSRRPQSSESDGPADQLDLQVYNRNVFH